MDYGVIGISSANAITLSSFCRSADVFLSRRLFIFQVSPVVQLESDLPGTPGPENDGVNDGTEQTATPQLRDFPRDPRRRGTRCATELCYNLGILG